MLQIGVKAIFRNDEGLFLFIKRSSGYTQSNLDEVWDIPGGRLNERESLIDALKREITEEIGYTLTNIPKLLAAQDIFVEKKNLHVVRLTYLVNENVKDIKLSKEHSNYSWISLDDLYTLNLDPYIKAVLEVL
jgi:8-oxo-dGTP diphosphatase